MNENEGIHLDLDSWIVPGQILKANLRRGLGSRNTVLLIEGCTMVGCMYVCMYLCA